MSEPLSPGQALHLADDPGRAALARDTSEQQVFVAEAVREPVAIVAERGWLQRVWRRLKRAG